MEQDVVMTLVGFGVLAVAIIGVKIFVHTKAHKMAEERKAAQAETEENSETK